jgi:succinate dehydrogenase / fumarate reductase cytochrome b subunit
VLALVALGTHLFHGLWSLFQTLGLNHPKWNAYRNLFAAGFAALLVVGFLAVPIGVVLGLIR